MSFSVRLGLRARATVAWAAIALCLAVGLALLGYQLTRTELVSDREGRASAQAYLNGRVLRSALRSNEPDVAQLLSALEGNAGSQAVTLFDGEWYAGSVGASPDQLPESLTAVVESGSAGRQLTTVGGVPHVVVGVPIAEVDADYYEFVSLEDVEDLLSNLAVGLAVGAAAATVAAALAGWYASGRVLRPLRRMSEATTAIADGRFDARLDEMGDPDLEPLQRSFNRMADAVEQRIEREHRFTSDVSHELRSPLAAMMSAISIARRSRNRGDEGTVNDALDHLELRTEAFHQLVVDLLEISRADAGQTELELEAVELQPMLEAVVAMTGVDGCLIEIAPDAPATITADKRRLGRMVVNLLENAERYAGGATRIAVDRQDGRLQIVVEDEGPGVPEHERHHIFGRFARGEQARNGSANGTGLGLALVEEHARLHGGGVTVESSESGGARFVIDLPIPEVGS